MARLLDCFSPLLSFGLELDTAIRTAQLDLRPEAVQQQALDLLEAARRAARDAGAEPGQIESASFALVAWLDEMMARNRGWTAPVTPLQVRLFASNNAQSEFFHHLSALRPEDDEVREVYWTALVHGFKGQYYFEDGDDGELGKLKALHGQQLRTRATPPGPASAPEDRDTRTPPHAPARRSRALLRGAAVLALLAPIGYGLWQLTAAPRVVPPTLEQRVEQRLQDYACADLSAIAAPDGTTRVSGFVSLPEDVARVARDVRAVPGVQSTTFDLDLRVWPHCEVLALLKPYQARNRDKRHGLRVQAITAQNGRLREGDVAVMRVTQANYDGHLWVDYYTASGAVLHLNAGRSAVRVRAGEAIELGRDIPSSWLVSPPFGTVLVTVMASPLPLAETFDRPPFELASDYLQRLRESLAANEVGGRLIADLLFLETVER